jgi:hypothetical protein
MKHLTMDLKVWAGAMGVLLTFIHLSIDHFRH